MTSAKNVVKQRTQQEIDIQTRVNLANAYRDLLNEAGEDRTLLLQGIENLGGISNTNRAELEALNSAELINRIQLTIQLTMKLIINDLDPQPIEFSHSGVYTKATETAQETNEHGVSMEAITSLVDGFKLAFRVTKEAVLARFNTHLTPEKLRQIQYFQFKGHGIDVPSITTDGEVELASCSEVAPRGHRNMNYFDAEDLLIQPEFAGVDFMTGDQAINLLRAGATLDRGSWSNLKSPNAGTRAEPGRAVYCNYSYVCVRGNPIYSHIRGAFRVWLRV
jgi:hypothetical protein